MIFLAYDLTYVYPTFITLPTRHKHILELLARTLLQHMARRRRLFKAFEFSIQPLGSLMLGELKAIDWLEHHVKVSDSVGSAVRTCIFCVWLVLAFLIAAV